MSNWVQIGSKWRSKDSLIRQTIQNNNSARIYREKQNQAKLNHEIELLSNQEYIRIQVPYARKDEFKEYLSINRIYSIWDSANKCWILSKLNSDHKAVQIFAVFDKERVREWLHHYGHGIKVTPDQLIQFKAIVQKHQLLSFWDNKQKIWFVDKIVDDLSMFQILNQCT